MEQAACSKDAGPPGLASVFPTPKTAIAGDHIIWLAICEEFAGFEHLVQNKLHLVCGVFGCCVIPVGDEENAPSRQLSPIDSVKFLKNDTAEKRESFIVQRCCTLGLKVISRQAVCLFKRYPVVQGCIAVEVLGFEEDAPGSV